MVSMGMHITDETKKCFGLEKTRLAIVSDGLTKKLQPLNLCINQAFKAHMRHHWESWMSAENHTFTKGGQVHKATYSEVSEWIFNSWNRIPKDMMERAFLKAEITDYAQNSANGVPRSSNVVSDQDCLSDSHSDDKEFEYTRLDIDEHLPPELLELFHIDTESEDFEGFSDIEN